VKPLSDGAIRAIFTKPQPPEDPRPFLVRLITSIKMWGKVKFHNGKKNIEIGVKGEVEF
jgi:hypothetical protein